MLKTLFYNTIFLFSFVLYPQSADVEMLPYGNMDDWMVREIEESYIIGGNTQYLYEVTNEKDTLKNNQPYKNNKSPWATSSVYANINGVKKGSVTVFPEERPGNGLAAH